MRVILSAAISLDGYLDDCSAERLKLSGPEDWADVLALRARCDAILVGAGTIRNDNPSLIIKKEEVRNARAKMAMEPEPAKVTITRSGNISPSCDFFTRGNGRKIVFATCQTPPGRIAALRERAEVFVEDEVKPDVISDRLARYGCRTLMVEGGSRVLGMFLQSGNIALLRLAMASFFVGDGNSPRFTPDGLYPWGKDNRLVLRSVEALGDTSVMWMVPPAVDRRDREYLSQAVEISRQSPPCDTAYRVGAVVVASDGKIYTGYTHETGPSDHAEEAAVAKAERAGSSLIGSAVYSSMEPCTHRKSKPLPCSDLIILKGVSKVVYALPEPSDLAICEGHERLRAAGVEVVRIDTFDREVRRINRHIIARG